MTEVIDEPIPVVMKRVTVAVPTAMVTAANELAACVGFGEADRLTFVEAPAYEDATGQSYRVASCIVWGAFMLNAVETLQEPEWGADMVAVVQAQEALTVLYLTGEEDMGAKPDRITVLVGDDAEEAMRQLQVTKV